MNAKAFVSAIDTVVFRSAVRGILNAVRQPPGRRPDSKLVKLSEWFNRLETEEQEYIAAIATLAADQATYNFLLVLDGLLAIEDSEAKGELSVVYSKGDERVILNTAQSQCLSVLFKEFRA